MINLCLVVIATQFAETKRRETERMIEERKRLRSSGSLSWFNKIYFVLLQVFQFQIFVSKKMASIISGSDPVHSSRDGEAGDSIYAAIIKSIRHYSRRLKRRFLKVPIHIYIYIWIFSTEKIYPFSKSLQCDK